MSARVSLQPAYLLAARPYRDTSLLLEAWTPECGRVGLVARGARGPRAPRRALLQVLQPLLLSWSQQGELGLLTAVEADGLARPYVGETLFCAWYLNELLLRLVARQDPHPVLYLAYVDAMNSLELELEPGLRRFELRLLAELGYGLSLPEEIEAERTYRYDWDNGPVFADSGAQGAVPGTHLIDLREGRFRSAQSLAAARYLLRAALARQLGDQPLRSAALLRALKSKERGRANVNPAVAKGVIED